MSIFQKLYPKNEAIQDRIRDKKTQLFELQNTAHKQSKLAMKYMIIAKSITRYRPEEVEMSIQKLPIVFEDQADTNLKILKCVQELQALYKEYQASR